MPFVEVLHELGKPAGITIGGDRGCERDGIDRAFIGDGDREAGVQEREFPQPVGEHIVVEGRRLEDRCIRDKVDPGAGQLVPELLRGRLPGLSLLVPRGIDCAAAARSSWPEPEDPAVSRGPVEGSRFTVPLLVPGEELAERLFPGRESGGGLALGKPHLIDIAVPVDLGREPVGECIDHRDTDTVETARDLVGLLVELAACVEDGQHDFEGTLVVLLHPVDRNTPAVILDHERAVLVDDDCDPGAEPGKCFVNRVVDDLVDEVVQAAGIGAADVHRRTLPDRGESFENRDMGCIVRVSQGKPPLKK